MLRSFRDSSPWNRLPGSVLKKFMASFNVSKEANPEGDLRPLKSNSCGLYKIMWTL